VIIKIQYFGQFFYDVGHAADMPCKTGIPVSGSPRCPIPETTVRRAFHKNCPNYWRLFCTILWVILQTV